MKTQFLLKLMLLFIPILSGALTGYGQVSSAAPLSGTVTDPSGAVVQGAAIFVKNDATSATFNATTVNNGTFTIPTLSPGTYTVTVTAPGFKQAIINGVKIDASTPASVQVSLEVGATTETVTVQGGGNIVQTQTAAISTTIVGRQITERFNFELRGEFLNAFNQINFITNSFTNVGGFTSANFGQVNSAYRDIANTNETGGRTIQLVARFNF